LKFDIAVFGPYYEKTTITLDFLEKNQLGCDMCIARDFDWWLKLEQLMKVDIVPIP
jgi:hypothetical protein